MANGPSILLADKPTRNLDSKHKLEIVRLIRKLSSDQGMTSIMVTHDDRIASMASRSIFLKDGHVRSKRNRVPVPLPMDEDEEDPE